MKEPYQRTAMATGTTLATGALVMSRACPDDSPLADEFPTAGAVQVAHVRYRTDRDLESIDAGFDHSAAWSTAHARPSTDRAEHRSCTGRIQ
ncbi:hypothetical protein ASD35_06975 [Pelomonas sp. Root1444]|nr:hypothetical protein ASD35_06975 [Pelomonas sp. Root1444]